MRQADSSSRISGIGASPGLAIGEAVVINPNSPLFLRLHLPPERREAEVARLEEAVAEAVKELEALRREVSSSLGEDHLYILDVGLMLLRDKSLIGAARERIEEQHYNCEWAVKSAVDHFARTFESVNDEYLRGRKADVEQAGDRILRHLTNTHQRQWEKEFEAPSIAVAHDLSPADTATFSRGRVVGIVTDLGGRTSHTAIMAGSLGIPAVVGAGDATRRISTGDRLIVNGSEGLVIVNPSPEEITAYEADLGERIRAQKESQSGAAEPARTKDGVRIEITANIEFEDEMDHLDEYGAEGVGLFRSEHLYFNRRDVPSEEEHYRQYRRLAEAVGPRKGVVRTLDLGFDRLPPSFLALPGEEANPALGLRGIRISLRRRDVFMRQLRAVLRAAVHGNLCIMYPFLSNIEELREARSLLQEAKAELEAEGAPFSGSLAEGMMIDTPAAAICADSLAREADFIGIGSNDLTQYVLAVDRTNQQVAHLFESFHPAMLRLLKEILEKVRPTDVPVYLCGEIASNPLNAVALVGLGFRTLSVALSKVGEVKRRIRRYSLSDLEALASALMSRDSVSGVQAVLEEFQQDPGRFRPSIRPAV